jgi:hypothetical protein
MWYSSIFTDIKIPVEDGWVEVMFLDLSEECIIIINTLRTTDNLTTTLRSE